MDGLCAMDEQDSALSHCSAVGTAREQETDQTTGPMEENGRKGDERSGQDLE